MVGSSLADGDEVGGDRDVLLSVRSICIRDGVSSVDTALWYFYPQKLDPDVVRSGYVLGRGTIVEDSHN